MSDTPFDPSRAEELADAMLNGYFGDAAQAAAQLRAAVKECDRLEIERDTAKLASRILEREREDLRSERALLVRLERAARMTCDPALDGAIDALDAHREAHRE